MTDNRREAKDFADEVRLGDSRLFTKHILAYPNNPALGCISDCKACAYDAGYAACKKEGEEMNTTRKQVLCMECGEILPYPEYIEDKYKGHILCVNCGLIHHIIIRDWRVISLKRTEYRGKVE